MKIDRIILIGREMLPSLDLIVRSVIRVGVGGALIFAANKLSPSWQWFSLVGHMLITLALISFVSHAETVFSGHAASKLRVIGRGVWDVLMIPVHVVGFIVAVSRMSSLDDDNQFPH